jgi:lycopene beta-cyclase
MVDVAVVGGGLSGSLAAWRLATSRPDLRLCVIESGPRLGGNHTWSFHDTDVPAAALTWLAPVVTARWPGHEVRFPSGRRTLSGAYLSITSTRLHDVIVPRLGDRLRLDTPVRSLGVRSVTLESGEEIQAGLVLDARGGIRPPVPVGWQTFVGQDLELTADHGLVRPIIMDATVPQAGGFRFVYVLPWGPRHLLVEDTLYAETPAIDHAACRAAIGDYVARQGWAVHALVREETGALPIPLGGRAEAFWPDDTVRIGMRAGLFHPTTGYSLPDAVATADLLAGLDLSDRDRVYQKVRQVAETEWRKRGFFRLLNRMLFRAAGPSERAGVLQQFYQRPEPLIARFYAARLTRWDQLRILSGRPPVPVTRALAHLWDN